MRLHTKIGYGVAESGIAATDMMIKLYLLIFYTDTVGLDAKYAGYAVALAVIWDAFTDPIIGVLSDNTNSRRGKRSPYMLLGGISLAISVLVILYPPQMQNQLTQFMYLLLSYMFLNTSMTLLSIPHSALGGDLTVDNPDGRIEIYGWRFLFTNIGAFAALLPGYAIASLVLVTSLITFFATSKYDKKITVNDKNFDPQKTFLQTVKDIKVTSFIYAIPNTLKNKVFCFLFFSYVVATIGLTINATLAFYYYKYRLNLDKEQVDIIIGLFILVICISVLFWVLISKKYGKKWPAFWGILLLAIMTIFCYPLFPKEQIFPPLCAAIFGGIMAGSVALLDALVADTVDSDPTKAHSKKEGLYFGVWRMGAKIARAIAIAICGIWLSAIGFQANEEQSLEVSRQIAYMFGPGVGVFLLVAVAIFFFIPIKKQDTK